MSDQGHAEKTEDPTPRRRQEFRDRGDIARSQDIGGVAILTGSLTLVLLHGGYMYRALDGNLRGTLSLIAEPHGPRSAMAKGLESGALAFVHSIAAFFAVVMALGIIAGVSQTGGNVASKAFEIKWSKFNPFTGLVNQLLNVAKLQEVGLAMLKAAAIGTVLYSILRSHVSGLLALASLPLVSGLAYIGGLVMRLLIAAILISAVLATIDYYLAFRRIKQQMKMTKQEVKDERKQAEGDPMIKNKMRLKMLQMGYNRILAATREADVVIVNPTHYAVALAYKPERDAAPRLLAKGKDAMAFRIREVARKRQIPIVSNPPVARAIYATAKVGHEIPAELYEIVARVLAYVYRMTRRVPA